MRSSCTIDNSAAVFVKGNLSSAYEEVEHLSLCLKANIFAKDRTA